MVDDIVRPAKRKGYVKTRSCTTINEVTEWVVKEKTVKVKPKDYTYDLVNW